MPLALVRQTGFGLCRIYFDFFNTVSGNAPYFFGDYLILTLKSGLVKGKIYFVSADAFFKIKNPRSGSIWPGNSVSK
jgi:hypothetical protein